jgi:hypothetical protein
MGGGYDDMRRPLFWQPETVVLVLQAWLGTARTLMCLWFCGVDVALRVSLRGTYVALLGVAF